MPAHLTESLTELGRLDPDPGVEAALGRVSRVAHSALPGVIGVSFSVLNAAGLTTCGASTPLADSLDAAQYASNGGPCMTALSTRQQVHIPDVDVEERWPLWLPTARAAQVGTMTSLPVGGTGGIAAALNVYARSPGCLGGNAVRTVLRVISAQTSVLLANLTTYRAAVCEAEQLHEAMAGRAELERAKGALMCMLGVDQHIAWDYLLRLSHEQRTTVHDMAVRINRHSAAGQCSVATSAPAA